MREETSHEITGQVVDEVIRALRLNRDMASSAVVARWQVLEHALSNAVPEPHAWTTANRRALQSSPGEEGVETEGGAYILAGDAIYQVVLGVARKRSTTGIMLIPLSRITALACWDSHEHAHNAIWRRRTWVFTGDGLRIAIPTRRVLTAPADPLDRILAPPVGEPDRAEVFTQEVAGRRGWNLPAG